MKISKFPVTPQKLFHFHFQLPLPLPFSTSIFYSFLRKSDEMRQVIGKKTCSIHESRRQTNCWTKIRMGIFRWKIAALGRMKQKKDTSERKTRKKILIFVKSIVIRGENFEKGNEEEKGRMGFSSSKNQLRRPVFRASSVLLAWGDRGEERRLTGDLEESEDDEEELERFAAGDRSRRFTLESLFFEFRSGDESLLLLDDALRRSRRDFGGGDFFRSGLERLAWLPPVTFLVRTGLT
jgi:hypothetical protein